MKILVYALNHSPEPIGVGKYVGEMVQWLSQRGHSVRVVAAPPYYPRWKIENGYSRFWYSREVLDGARVTRCPIWVPGTQTAAKRLVHLCTFALSSSVPVLAISAMWRPDVLWTVIPTSFGLPAALLAARLCRSRSWLHVQDFELDAAAGLGFVGKPHLREVAAKIERGLLRSFDRVSSISDAMVEGLTAKSVDKSRVVNFPNWVDCEHIYPLEGSNRIRAQLGIPDDCVVALYSGNLGAKQGVEMLAEVARLLNRQTNIHVVVCGDGAARDRLAAAAGCLGNLTLLPLLPAESLNELLNAADIHLLPQKTAAADLVMPSKLGGMLASGRPVIAAAPPHTGLAREISGCGIVVDPEDAGAMANALIVLARSPERRRELGHAARGRALEHWDKHAILGRFEQELASLAGRGDSAQRQPQPREAI